MPLITVQPLLVLSIKTQGSRVKGTVEMLRKSIEWHYLDHKDHVSSAVL